MNWNHPHPAPLPPGGPGKRRKHRTRFWITLGISLGVLGMLAIFGIGWGLNALKGGIELNGEDISTVPDKYQGTNFTNCETLQSRVSDLPHEVYEIYPDPESSKTRSGFFKCNFSTGKKDETQVEVDLTWSRASDYQTGSEQSYGYFLGVTSRSDDTPVGLAIGQKQRWLHESRTGSCGVAFLDRNAVFEVHYTLAKADLGGPPDTCRTALFKYSQEIYKAVQP